MGQILRLDGRIEIEEQQCDAVGVVTRVVDGGACGRVWPIEAHRKPELRLNRWSKGNPLRHAHTTVVVGYGGDIDYQDLSPGIYQATSATYSPIGVHKPAVIFRVNPGATVEVIARDATGPIGRDATLCVLSGWTPERLAAEREGYAADLAARRAAEGFAPLTVGRPSQVVWADEFRGTKLRHAFEYLDRRQADHMALESAPAVDSWEEAQKLRKSAVAIDWLEYAHDQMKAVEDASWWVARVSTPGADILREFAAELRAASKAARAELAGKGAPR